MNPHAHLPKNFDTLEVGGWYMDGRGKIHFCVRYDPFSPIGLEFITDTLLRFYPRGEMFSGAKTDFDLTHRVNPDGSLWTGEALKPAEAPEAKRQTNSGGITVRSLTLELTQTLPSGEEQTIIVEHDGDTATVSTENWTEQTITIAHVAEAATEALATARIRTRVLQLENKP